MEREEVVRRLEELAGTVVLAEPARADDDTLRALRKQLVTVRRGMRGRGKTRVVKIAKSVEELIDRILGGEGPTRSRLFEVLEVAISALQGILRDGRDPKEALEGFEQRLAALDAPRGPAPALESGGEAKEGPKPPDGVPSSCFPSVDLSGDDEILGEFIAESREHLESIERELLLLEKGEGDEESINTLFRGFHTIKGVAAHLGLEAITSLAHETENLLDRVRSNEQSWDDRIFEAVFRAGDLMSRLLDGLADSGATSRPEGLPALCDRLRELAEGRSRERLETERATAPRPEPGASGEASPATSEEPPPLMPPREGGTTDKRAPRSPARGREYVRVDADRLDRLVETIGELVTGISVMGQLLASFDLGQNADTVLKDVKKISADLQELGTSLRMVPLRSLLQHMQRVVRDLAHRSGKPVDVVVIGEDTELDKSMVEQLADPLTHLMRNAVDHGIEPNVADRRARHKPDRGTIEIRAYHQGGSIYIEVEDDGVGIDRSRILEKARETGLVGAEESPTDSELYGLIFEPGFSTAGRVTSISGRGVGMDVVKQNIEALHGSIDIATEPGFGTLFTMRLPLTIAIIDGMVVRAGAERYILPTPAIVRSVRVGEEDLATVLDRDTVIKTEEALIPLHKLADLFEIDGAVDDPTEALVVIVENGGRRLGILVDELLGQQQIVIKNLGGHMGGVSGIAGGAVMADGRVGLVVDVAGLMSFLHTSDSRRLRHAV